MAGGYIDALSRLESALEAQRIELAVGGLQAPSDRSLYGFGYLSGITNGLQLALDTIKDIRRDLDEKDAVL